MGQVRIGKIAYNGDRTTQLLIFKNEIVTNTSTATYPPHQRSLCPKT